MSSRSRVWRAATVAAAALALVGLAMPAAEATPGGRPVPGAPSVRPPAPLPTKPVTVTISPSGNALVGIAYPITATFSHIVIDRVAAERHLPVFVNGVRAAGAWYWVDSSTAMYRLRPKPHGQGFWPGHARIEVRASLAGVVLVHTSTLNYVGAPTTTRVSKFRTPAAFVALVSATTDMMRVTLDGKLARVIPVSLGKPGWITRSGIKTTMEKYVAKRMTSQALGITDPSQAYDLIAPYATRLTYSGEFVHGAPWATGRLGRWNGSHGCTNVSVSDAKWFYDTVVEGDPVITTGTTKPTEYYNTIGGVYNMPWAQWLARSALKGKA